MENSSLPSHVRDFLEGLMEGKLEDYAVEQLNGNEKGEGHLAELIFLRLTNNISKKRHHLAIKHELSFEATKAPDHVLQAFRNETYFYKKAWPILKKFHSSVSSKDFDAIPRCYGVTEDDNGEQIIALEDLRYAGYKLHNRLKPLDKAHYELIFKTYGVYHAISIAFRERQPEDYLQLVKPLVNIYYLFLNSGFMVKMIMENFKSILEYFSNDGNENADLLKMIQLYSDEGHDIFTQSLKYDGQCPIFLHGDCWSNNMMFKYDHSGKLTNMKLLDFQLLGTGSAVHDLSYAFYSGASKETLDNLDYYLKVYHDSLSKTLQEFELDPAELYPMESLKFEWHKYSKFGFVLGILLWKMKFMDRETAPDFTKSLSEIPDVKLASGVSSEYWQRVTDLLNNFYENVFITEIKL